MHVVVGSADGRVRCACRTCSHKVVQACAHWSRVELGYEIGKVEPEKWSTRSIYMGIYAAVKQQQAFMQLLSSNGHLCNC